VTALSRCYRWVRWPPPTVSKLKRRAALERLTSASYFFFFAGAFLAGAFLAGAAFAAAFFGAAFFVATTRPP